jgi:hypothetical protein
MFASLSDIQNEVERRARVIGASGDSLPTYGRSEDFGRPHIEIDSRGYHYVNEERGNEVSRRTTQDLDELLYFALRAGAFAVASRYAVKHSVKGQDFRRPLFQRKVELLTQLSPAWGERCSKELEAILVENPFVDR